MNFKSLKYHNMLTFVILVILFLAVIIINNLSLRNIRLDLTENKLYTLSQGTYNILENIKEPITLHLFFSQKVSQDLQAIRNYHTRVKEMLEEYQRHAKGRLIVKYTDPEPFSEEEDRAAELGIQAVKVKGEETLYFGLAGTNTVDNVETIPFFQQNKEVFLEYDLDKLIYSLSQLKKPVLGLMTTLNMYPTQLNPQTGKMNDAWAITNQIEQLFDVRLVHSDEEIISDDIDLLMIVHPRNLAEKTLYAIDQFIMRGGKGLFFVDPFSEAQYLPTPANKPLEDAKVRGSSLNKLFNKWGFKVEEDYILGDAVNALQVNLTTGGKTRHVAMLGIRSEFFNREDAVTQGLQSVNMAMASYIELTNKGNADLTLEPLIESSDKSMPISIQRFRFIHHPDILWNAFRPKDKRYTIAARIRGPLQSAFDGPPANEAEEGEEGDKAAEELPPHISETSEAAELAVIADTDLLTDRLWARKQNFFGQSVIQPFSSNRDFVINLIESLFGSTDLINVRSRASYSRPFTRINKIRELADRKFRQVEDNLQTELAQVNVRLRELEDKRTDKGATLFTVQQQQEINLARQRRIEVRKELRNVRHEQVKEIERLGTTLKIINIGAVPAVVILIAIILGIIRIRSRRRRQAV